MKDGVKVRTIEELRQHFDAEKMFMYYTNGKLLTWLSDRHYDSYIERIKAIDPMKNPLLEISRIFEIDTAHFDKEINIQKLQQLQQKNDKIMQIKQYTDKDEILQNIDLVAMNQEELEDLLETSKDIIYLCGKEFICPLSIENIVIEGINTPVIKINSTDAIDFDEKKVVFKNIIFDEAYQVLLEKQKQEIEHRNDKRNTAYRASSLFDIRLSDEDRRKSQKLYALLQKELVDVTFDVDIYTQNMKKILEDADLYDAFDIDIIGKKQKECLKNARLDDAFFEFCNRFSD